MYSNIHTQNQNLANSFHCLIGRNRPEDISIDIFSESMSDYLKKLNAASEGRYELDDYDMQVITVAMDQCLKMIL